MTTNLVISYPDIPFAATEFEGDTFDSDRTLYNQINGPRYWRSKRASASTSHIFTCLLPTGTTKAVDHLIISHADLLISQGVTDIDLDSSADNAAWTNRIAESTFGSYSLIGRGFDYVTDITATSAFQYWRLTYTSSSSTLERGKAYFGTWFDFGYEPVAYDIERIPAREAVFFAGSGAKHFVRGDEPVYRFTFHYEGPTDDKIRDFYNYIVKYKHINPVFLYTRSDHTILDNARIVHCNLVEAVTQQRTVKNDYNRLTVTYEEILG